MSKKRLVKLFVLSFTTFFLTQLLSILNINFSNILFASGTTPYYLVGNFAGESWNLGGTSYPLTLESGTIYKWTGQLSQGTEFKVRDSSGSWEWVKGWGNVLNVGAKESGTISDASGNIKVNSTYIFDVRFDSSNDDIKIDLGNINPASLDGVNGSRMRIWLDRGVYMQSGNEIIGLQFGSSISNTTEIITPSGYVERSANYFYAYYDIPILTVNTSIRVLRLSSTEGIYNTSSTLVWSNSDYNKTLAITGWEGSNLVTRAIPDDQSNIKNTFLAKVLEGYLTCSNSTANGFGGFAQVRGTYFFFSEGTGGVRTILGETLGAVTLTDYAYGSNYNSNRGTGIQVNALHKYNALALAAGVAIGDIA